MYQYTARDIKTGALFVSLAHTHNRHTAAIFADRVLTHLKGYGITPRVIQTDNGTEFVNTRDATDETPLFIQVVTRNGDTKHRRIPPGAKT
jgi:transposase-like protein